MYTYIFCTLLTLRVLYIGVNANPVSFKTMPNIPASHIFKSKRPCAMYVLFYQSNSILDDYDVYWNQKLGCGISGPVRYVTILNTQCSTYENTTPHCSKLTRAQGPLAPGFLGPDPKGWGPIGLGCLSVRHTVLYGLELLNRRS